MAHPSCHHDEGMQVAGSRLQQLNWQSNIQRLNKQVVTKTAAVII
jgi:hypothetical protein